MNHRQSINSMCLAFALFLGLATVWGFAAASVLEQLTIQPRQPQYDSLIVGVDGRIEITTSRQDPVYEVIERRTLDGAPIDLSQPPPVQANGASLAGRPREENIPWDRPWQTFMRAYNDGRSPARYWYAVSQGTDNPLRRRTYFVGYDSRSKYLVGYLGKSGFRPDLPPESDWFDEGFNTFYLYSSEPVYSQRPTYGQIPTWRTMLQDDHAIREVNLQTYQIREVLSADQVWSWSIATQPVGPLEENQAAQRTWQKIAVRTPGEIHLVDILADGDPAVGATYQTPPELDDGSCSFFLLADNTAIATFSFVKHRPADMEFGAIRIVWFDDAGQVTRSQDILLNPGRFRNDDGLEILGISVIAPTPIVSVLVGSTYPYSQVQQGYVDTYSEGLAEFFVIAWPALLGLLLVCGFFAWLAYRRQQKFHQPHALGWAVFVFVFGPMGYLAYLFHRRRPPLVECPSCGARVPRDRDNCASCGVQFPAPQPLGIEVFA